jgi:hypothetical protein
MLKLCCLEFVFYFDLNIPKILIRIGFLSNKINKQTGFHDNYK